MQVEDIMVKEANIVKECLDVSTLDELLFAIRDIMITQVSMQILNHTHFQQFMEE